MPAASTSWARSSNAAVSRCSARQNSTAHSDQRFLSSDTVWLVTLDILRLSGALSISLSTNASVTIVRDTSSLSSFARLSIIGIPPFSGRPTTWPNFMIARVRAAATHVSRNPTHRDRRDRDHHDQQSEAESTPPSGTLALFREETFHRLGPVTIDFTSLRQISEQSSLSRAAVRKCA